MAWMKKSDVSQEEIETYLENMECFELDVLALIPQQVHHHFEVGLVRNVPCHDVEVRTIKEDFPQKLE